MQSSGKMWKRAGLAALLAALAMGGTPAQAQNYPNKMIRLVVGAPPGSMPDTVPRMMTEKLGQQLGQPVVIEPRPGAAGLTSSQYVARGPADGYLIHVYTSSDTLAPLLNPGLVDPKELTPVATVATVPTVLVVAAGRSFKSLDDIVRAAKVDPGKLVASSAGYNTATHLSLERFRQSAGVDILHVPAKGGVAALTEVLGDRADLYFAPVPTAMEMVRSGKLRMISMASPKRSMLFPDVPTSLELGYKDSDYYFWIGISVASKTPAPIIQRLNREINATVADKEMVERFLKVGAEPLTMPMPEFQAMVRAELETNAVLIKTKGFRPE
jgi:tripartite-type tricarboxylate transporter receptor subunit TctC